MGKNPYCWSSVVYRFYSMEGFGLARVLYKHRKFGFSLGWVLMIFVLSLVQFSFSSSEFDSCNFILVTAETFNTKLLYGIFVIHR